MTILCFQCNQCKKYLKNHRDKRVDIHFNHTKCSQKTFNSSTVYNAIYRAPEAHHCSLTNPHTVSATFLAEMKDVVGCAEVGCEARVKAAVGFIEMHKYTNGKYNVDTSWLQLKKHHLTRGHPLQLAKQHCNLEVRSNVFSQRVVQSWNSLPEEVVCAPSLNYAFKARVDKFWADHKYQS